MRGRVVDRRIGAGDVRGRWRRRRHYPDKTEEYFQSRYLIPPLSIRTDADKRTLSGTEGVRKSQRSSGDRNQRIRSYFLHHRLLLLLLDASSAKKWFSFFFFSFLLSLSSTYDGRNIEPAVRSAKFQVLLREEVLELVIRRVRVHEFVVEQRLALGLHWRSVVGVA